MSKIRVEHVSHSFKGQLVMNDITVSFEKGLTHGIVGNNGSGKTLLFKVICGYLRPQVGRVYIDNLLLGKDFDFPPNMGLILEVPGFILEETAYRNLEILWSLRGKPDKAAIMDTLSRVGLSDVGNKRVGKYSLGMRQRLGIAQAIMESPDLLILDEPFNGLDKQGVKDIRNLLKEQQKGGTTILLSSHITEDIEVLCDKVYEMESGCLYAQL